MKTILAYKLFGTRASMPGLIFPLFIGKDTPTPIGQWALARVIPTPGFAVRPGWHVGPLPIAKHLLCKDGTLAKDRVWAEVEIPAEVDWTEAAQDNKTKDLRHIPVGGYYRFPRPNNQGGEWWIAGAIFVRRLLTPEQVKEILSK